MLRYSPLLLSSRLCKARFQAVSADYPYWDATNQEIVAVVEATSVPLTDFRFAVLMIDDEVVTYDALDLDGDEVYIEAGGIDTIRADVGEDIYDDVWAVQILTSCPDVKSGWYELVTY